MKCSHKYYNVWWKNLFFIFIFLFILSITLPGSAAPQLVIDKGDPPICNELNDFIKSNIKEGLFIRNKLTPTVPVITTNFRDDFTSYRNPIRVLDIDNDGDYELIYLVDITKPAHVRTNIYLLMDLSIEEAESLIKKGMRSEFYNSTMSSLWENYQWNSIGDIDNATPIVINHMKYFHSSDHKPKPKITYRVILFNFNKHNYLLIEQLGNKNKRRIAILTVNDIEREKFNFVCEFSIIKN